MGSDWEVVAAGCVALVVVCVAEGVASIAERSVWSALADLYGLGRVGMAVGGVKLLSIRLCL